MRRSRESPWQSRARQALDGYTSVGRDIFQVKQGVRGARSLQTAILQLAYALEERADLNGHLILVNPGLSTGRVFSEWEKASSVLRGPIRDRLHIIIADGTDYTGIPDGPSEDIRRHLPNLIGEKRGHEERLPRPDYFFVVLKILLHQWLAGAGPVTTLWLAETAGCTYPTVAKALDRLGHTIRRSSDRRVELDRFPREAWNKMLAVSDDIRLTRRFSDRSGKPRLPDQLLRRLKKMDRSSLAVGGSIGARHWYPGLDLVGDPKLDLSIHCPAGQLDLEFVTDMDPALEMSLDRLEPAALTIHVIRRKDPLFQTRPDGLTMADPVECLLDLHEMRFEPQALEFMKSFGRKGGNL